MRGASEVEGRIGVRSARLSELPAGQALPKRPIVQMGLGNQEGLLIPAHRQECSIQLPLLFCKYLGQLPLFHINEHSEVAVA